MARVKIKIEVTEELKARIQEKSSRVGLSMSAYLRTLAIKDLDD